MGICLAASVCAIRGRMWRASVLTLYPELFPGPLDASVLGRGRADGLWALETVNIRDFSDNAYGSVDAPPFGGGAGLVMRADILAAQPCQRADGLSMS